MARIFVCKGDLPTDVVFKGSVAVDTETMGLNLHRDRLCVVQLSDGKGNAWLIQLTPDTDCVNLKKILTDPDLLKIFHYARFDVAKIYADLGVWTTPVYCTKIASKLCRTSAPHHGLKALCQDLLNITLCKEQQTSDWGSDVLTAEQQKYAANDVLYLHDLKEKLDKLLQREGRAELAQCCFDFMKTRAMLDLLDFNMPDVFEH